MAIVQVTAPQAGSVMYGQLKIGFHPNGIDGVPDYVAKTLVARHQFQCATDLSTFDVRAALANADSTEIGFYFGSLGLKNDHRSPIEERQAKAVALFDQFGEPA